jgi:hypothetical protein
MQTLDKASMGPLKTFCCQEIEKRLRSRPGRDITFYQIYELFGNTCKRATTGKIAANGSQATGVFPCDKYIFRPCDFPLSSEDKDVAPVNHPALIKTSDQPSFSSANFSPFTSAEALPSSDISPLPSLNLKPNPRGGAAKEITSSPYRTFVEATQKRKIKQATKSKTTLLASNVLGPSKRRKKRVCRDPTPSDTPSHSDTDLAVPFADDMMEKMSNKTLNMCSVLVVSLKTTVEKTRYDVRNVSDWRTHFVLVWRKSLFVSFVRDKHCFVRSLYLLYFYFFRIL